MRTATFLALVAVAALSGCGKGDACQQLCDEQETCGFGDADACYDNYQLALSLPGTRELTLDGCRTDLDNFTECDTTDTDGADSQ